MWKSPLLLYVKVQNPCQWPKEGLYMLRWVSEVLFWWNNIDGRKLYMEYHISESQLGSRQANSQEILFFRVSWVTHYLVTSRLFRSFWIQNWYFWYIIGEIANCYFLCAFCAFLLAKCAFCAHLHKRSQRHKIRLQRHKIRAQSHKTAQNKGTKKAHKESAVL
jgi:hypothetical protein